MTPPTIDFGDTSTFTSHGGAKKKKQAQKAADKAKWGEGSGDEGSKQDGDEPTGDPIGGGGADGGDGAGDNDGNGGAGGDGEDDGDWGGWGGGKKKKKGKKGKAGVDEEEEKRKQEKEAAAAAKKKEDEDAAANPGASLSWADDAIAEADGDYGFATAKPKKGKKSKVSTFCSKGTHWLTTFKANGNRTSRTYDEHI